MFLPHVAGAAVLMAQAHPEDTAMQIRSALIGSAQPLSSHGVHASQSAQGAGLQLACVDLGLVLTGDRWDLV